MFVGEYEGNMQLNADEVSEVCYKSMSDIKSDIGHKAGDYTEWFKIAFPLLEEWLEQNKTTHAAA